VTGRRPVQGSVVYDHRLTVRGEMDVELERVHTDGEGAAKGGETVLGP